jgi:hypothetical protein
MSTAKLGLSRMKLRRALGLVLSVGLFIPSPSQAKTVDLRTNPILDAVGIYDLHADFDVGNGWTVGPGFDFATANGTDGLTSAITVYQVDAIHHFGEGSFTHGWYLGPILYYSTGYINYSRFNTNGNILAIGARTGYQFAWDTFNMQLGAVAASSLGTFNLNLEFMIGWFF